MPSEAVLPSYNIIQIILLSLCTTTTVKIALHSRKKVQKMYANKKSKNACMQKEHYIVRKIYKTCVL